MAPSSPVEAGRSVSVKSPQATYPTDMRLLCQTLCEFGWSEQGLHRQLRWFGFLGFVKGLDTHLEWLVQLEPAFVRLSALLPGLESACRLMLDARRLRASLQAASVALPGASVLTTACSAPDTAGFPLPIRLPLPPSAAHSLMLAASHILVRVWNGHADASLPCNRVLWTFADPQDLSVYFSTGSGEPEPTFAELSIESACGRAAAICNAAAVSGALPPNGLPWPDNPAEFAAFRDLLERTDARNPLRPRLMGHPRGDDLPVPRPSDHLESADASQRHERKRGWGNRSSHNLLDRELLPEWTYGLSHKEAVALSAYFKSAPRPATTEVATRAELLAATGGFLALAGCITSSSISEAAEIPVLRLVADRANEPRTRPEGRQFLVERRPGRQGWVMRWLPMQRSGLGLELDLDSLNLGLTALHENCTLDELSPVPLSEIRREVLDRLGEQIGRTTHQADLCVKHALARLIFASTGNRGIVAHLCAGAVTDGSTFPDAPYAAGEDSDEEGGDEPGDDSIERGDGSLHSYTEDPLAHSESSPDGRDEQRADSPRREALSNYVHPCSAAVRDAYRDRKSVV